MKHIWILLGLMSLFVAVRCTEKGADAPPAPTVLVDGIGETGFRYDPKAPIQDGNYFFQAAKNTRIEDNWDLRDKAKYFPKVGDQGSCGDCWGYSTHHALEIYRGVNFGEQVDLSAQTMLSCSDIDAQNWGCNGGTMGAVSFLLRGLPPEADFPFKAQKVACKFSKDQLIAGWPNKVIEAPWVGESLEYSRYWALTGKTYTAQDKVSQIQQAQVALNSPAVVTVKAFGSSSYDVNRKCASKNSGGDHMVVNIGWDKDGGTKNGHLFNSWGPNGFGKEGIGRLQWEDASHNLCYGYGVEARVLRGELKPPCDPPENPNLKAEVVIFAGSKVELGRPMANVKCVWSPADGLKDPNSCVTDASPSKSTEYHLEVSNACGKITAMTLVRVFGPVLAAGPEEGKFLESETLVTPLGEVDIRGRTREL